MLQDVHRVVRVRDDVLDVINVEESSVLRSPSLLGNIMQRKMVAGRSNISLLNKVNWTNLNEQMGN